VEACNHADAPLIRHIEDAIGKAVEQSASDAWVDKRMAVGAALDACKAGIQCLKKFSTQALASLLIPADSVRDVCLRRPAKL
jgi:hypothetical protein